LVDKIRATAERLRDFPSAGPSREHLAPGLRVMLQGSYAVYYTHDDSRIVVVRVLHAARDATAVAEHGGFVSS
jgi:toxin ParE1/3/4